MPESGTTRDLSEAANAESGSSSSGIGGLEFDSANLPWPDRNDFEAVLARRVESGEIADDDAEALRHFRNHGYVAFPQLLEATQVEELIDQHDLAWAESWDLEALVEGRGVVRLPDLPPRAELGSHHYRINDIQDASEAVRRVILHRRILRFLKLYFEGTPVAMQSLFFEYGSEQATHQDFPYVQSRILSHLVGCWIACDDVGPDNGPLFYYPGSHRLPKFDWGGGSLTFDGEDADKVTEFASYLESRADAAGLERQTFHARRGDVFLWHGALVHGGSPATDLEATRRSLVVHYSSRQAYPRDRRYPLWRPEVYGDEGGAIYIRPKGTPSLMRRLQWRISDLMGS